MDAGEVLELVRSQPKGRAGFKTIARLSGAKGQARAALEQTLDALVEQGKLVEGRRGHYRLPDRKSGYLNGRFAQHPDGYGFITPDRPLPGVDGDLYVRRGANLDAMHGDRVQAEVVRIGPDGRAEARIRRILHHAQSLIVGRFAFSRAGSVIHPHDQRVGQVVEVLRGRELPPPESLGERLGNVTPPQVRSPEELDGMIVTVALSEYPTRFQPARGRVVEVLGREDDFGVDVEVMIRKHHLPYRFSAEALKEADEIPEALDQKELARRQDFRELPIVTIDGESARDFDDAVYVERLEDGGFALQVHVADVSHYVRPGDPLDRDARLRGTSAYFPDRAVPMLPARLSTGICSLNPESDRLVMSALLEIDTQGRTVRSKFARGVIRSARRMTYTNVFRVLEGDPDAVREYEDFAPRFRLMQDLAKILSARRLKRGAIDLDLPEAEILLDEQGRMTGVKPSERNIAHRIIEEFMLAANEAVAGELERLERPSLHRIHEPPSAKSLTDFETVARQFGRSLGVEITTKSFNRARRGRDGTKKTRQVQVAKETSVSSRDIQKFVEQLRGAPEARVLGSRLLRAMKQARYSEESKGHFALAAADYTHFTSPLRRYPDLVVHRVLGAQLDRDAQGPYSVETLAEIADQSSINERRAQAAERELLDWKKAKYIEGCIGDEFHALIVSVDEFGMWIELEELFVDGYVPLESFEGERFSYREKSRALVGARSKKQYSIGDRVKVRAVRVAFDRLRAEFACVAGG